MKYLIELLFDKNVEIKRMASAALDIVVEYDKNWAKKIREKKFQAFNSQWCEIVANDEKEVQRAITRQASQQDQDAVS